MYQFFESIKVENRKIYLADLHQQRICDTFRTFGKRTDIDLGKIFESLRSTENGLFKLRISYDLEDNFRTNLIPYAVSAIREIKLAINDEIEYPLKYEDRSTLEKMKSGAQEIIIVKNGYITDTSFSNLLFLKGKEWYTPDTFLLNGVQRQHLLKSKKIKKTEISLNNLADFSHFQIINAMNGFGDRFIYPLSLISNLNDFI